MEFKEIEQIVARNEDLPENADLHERWAYHLLNELYREFRSKMITPDQAKLEKKKLKKAFEDHAKQMDEYFKMYTDYQNNVKLSEEFRCAVNKGECLNDGIEELFLQACKVISAMTMDEIFWKNAKSLVERYGIEIVEVKKP